MALIPPAAQLLTGVLHPDLSPDDARKRWASSSPERCRVALDLCEAAGLTAYLAWRIDGEPPATATAADGTVDGLARRAADSRAATRALYMELAAVVDALQGAQVSVLLLKGADLGSRAYPRSDLRAMTDVDILVAQSDLGKALAKLEARGFRRDRNEAAHHVRLSRPGPPRFSLEVHTGLFDRPHGLPIREAELWARSMSMQTKIDGLRAQVLGPVDALVHVAAHAAWSDTLATPTAALRGALDLVLLTRSAASAEPGALAAAFWERTRRWRLVVPVDAAVEVAGQLFPGALTALEPGRPQPPRRPRARLARRTLMANAARALSGEHGTSRQSPRATTTRSMMAPTLPGAVWMLTAGAARALRRRR